MQTKSKSVRLFENEWLEALTRVPAWIPISFWGAVIFCLLFHSIRMGQIASFSYIFLGVSGIATWTLCEYLLHRILFHAEFQHPALRRMVFLMHTVHHDYPSDPERLLMPPLAAVPIALCFWFFFSIVIPEEYLFAFFGFFLVGYLIYDYTHYATHHWKMKSRYARELTRHHMLHHFSDQETRFGVSSRFWDRVFGT